MAGPTFTAEEQEFLDSLPREQRRKLLGGDDSDFQFIDDPELVETDTLSPTPNTVSNYLSENYPAVGEVARAVPDILEETVTGMSAEAGTRASGQAASQLATLLGPGKVSKGLRIALQALGVIGGGAAGGLAGQMAQDTLQGEGTDMLEAAAVGGIAGPLGTLMGDVIAPMGRDTRKAIDTHLRNTDRAALRKIKPGSRRATQIVEDLPQPDEGFARAMQPALGDMDATRGMPAIEAVKELQSYGELRAVSNLREFQDLLEKKIGRFETKTNPQTGTTQNYKADGELGTSIGRSIDTLAAKERAAVQSAKEGGGSPDPRITWDHIDEMFETVGRVAADEDGIDPAAARAVIERYKDVTRRQWQNTPEYKDLVKRRKELTAKQSKISAELAKEGARKELKNIKKIKSLSRELSDLGSELTELNAKVDRPRADIRQIFDEKRRYQNIGSKKRPDASPAESAEAHIGQLLGQEFKNLVSGRAIALDQVKSGRGTVTGPITQKLFDDSRKFELFQTARKAISKAGSQSLKRGEAARGGPSLHIRAGEAGAPHASIGGRALDWILGQGDPQETAFKQQQIGYFLRNGGVPDGLDIGKTDTDFLRDRLLHVPRRAGWNAAKVPTYGADALNNRLVRGGAGYQLGEMGADAISDLTDPEPVSPQLVAFLRDTPSGQRLFRDSAFKATGDLATVDAIEANLSQLQPEEAGQYLAKVFALAPQAQEAVKPFSSFEDLTKQPDAVADYLIATTGDPSVAEAFTAAIDAGSERDAIQVVAIAAKNFPGARALLPQSKKTGLLSEYSYKGETYLADATDVATYMDTIKESDAPVTARAAAASALNEKHPRVIGLTGRGKDSGKVSGRR